MKIIAAIPARAGSKGLKNKNIFKINRKPLVHYTFSAFQKSNLSLGYILTDSKKIKNLASRYSIITDYNRPKKMSKDDTSMIDTIFHFSEWLIKNKINYDYLMILQPTSALRTFNDINNAVKLVRKFKPNSLFSISESIEHPYETISKSKKNWKLIIKTKKKFTRRQDFGLESFFINGAIYVAHKKLIKKKDSLRKKKKYTL